MKSYIFAPDQARHVAMVIGQAFSVAYKEFLRATGISEAALEQAEYSHVLNAQSAPQAELELLKDKEKIRKVWFFFLCRQFPFCVRSVLHDDFCSSCMHLR